MPLSSVSASGVRVATCCQLNYGATYDYCVEDHEYNQLIAAQDCHGVGAYISGQYAE